MWSLSFDLERVLRRLKPFKYKANLSRRSLDALPIIDTHLGPGPELLLDTTVYIDGLQEDPPSALIELLTLRICNHSAVCLAELTHAFGRLDPTHPGTQRALNGISRAIKAIPAHRLHEPSLPTWGTAGILAGLAFRLGGFQRGTERKLLNDALVFLHAMENGFVVLSANVRDFDILNQLLPEGRILLYQTALRGAQN
jgi:predicted nucleic acid-binding protein